MEKDLKTQISTKCIHFTGIMNDACNIGISYKSVRIKPKDGGMYQFPCVSTGGKCDKCQFLTNEEVEKELNEIEVLSERMIIVYALIKSKEEQTGYIDCTCNGGKVKFVKAQSNGHIWCKCNKCDLMFNE